MARPKKPLPSDWKGTAHKPATNQQIITIHTLKSRLRMDDEPYVEVISRHGLGVVSSKDLNRKQASAVITELALKLNGPAQAAKPLSKPKGKAKAKAAPVTTRDNVVALATPPQRALIGHLAQEVDWHRHGSYEAWLLKNQKLEKVTTKEEARSVIEGLKGLKQHGHALNPAQS